MAATKPAAGRKTKPPKSVFREYIEAIGIALAIALVLRFFVIEAFKIPSGSMIETLAIGDFIFVNKLAYRTEIPYSLLGVRFPGGGTTLVEWDTAERGDIMVFRYPKDPSIDYIKRVVGLPGDTIEIKANRLYRNGEELATQYDRDTNYENLDEVAFRGERLCRDRKVQRYIEDNGDRKYPILLEPRPTRATRLQNDGPWTVPERHLFMMGDNRDNSSDSRVFGMVPFENVKGRALFVWLSLDPCQRILGGLLSKPRLSRVGHRLR